jgi:hypothetical protein
MIVGLAEFAAYLKDYFGFYSHYLKFIDENIKEKIFPKCVLYPYRIIGTISVKHGVSIEFIEQTSEYQFEVKMVPNPIEEAVLPQRKSKNGMFNVGASRFITFEGICFFSKEFYEKYVQDTSKITALTYSAPLDGFLSLSTGEVEFYHCSFGAIINGKPRSREIKEGLWIKGKNDANEFTTKRAQIHAKEAIDAALAQYIHPDFKIGFSPQNKETENKINKKIGAFEQLLSKEDIRERELQKYFEENPEFLYLGTRYKRIIPQPILKRKGKSDLIPDFLLERVNDGYCDILDIKLPDKKVVIGIEDRKRFSSNIDEALAQVSEYREYFNESKNRKSIEKKYNIKILKPNVLVLIGDSTNIDAEELIKIRDRRKDGEVITNSEIISQMKALLNIINQE